MIETVEFNQNEIEEVDLGRTNRFDIVELFEEMLSKRADLGYRPVLFVSSEMDLECNLIGLYESETQQQAQGEAVPVTKSVDELWKRIR